MTGPKCVAENQPALCYGKKWWGKPASYFILGDSLCKVSLPERAVTRKAIE